MQLLSLSVTKLVEAGVTQRPASCANPGQNGSSPGLPKVAAISCSNLSMSLSQPGSTMPVGRQVPTIRRIRSGMKASFCLVHAICGKVYHVRCGVFERQLYEEG